MNIAPKQRSDMEEAHVRAAEKKAARLSKTQPPAASKPHNIETVLDLGNSVYFHFRGRAYGMPPLPWRVGQRMLSLWLEVAAIKSPLTKDTRVEYARLLSQFPRLLWRNCYPQGRVNRWLRRLGLLRNPFNVATEQEIVELANFFLSRRMRSGASVPSVTMAHRPREATS